MIDFAQKTIYNICMNLIKKCWKWIMEDDETMFTGICGGIGIVVVIAIGIQEVVRICG